MNQTDSDRSPVPGREWVLVLAISSVGFSYLAYRLFQSWDQWPEDARSAALRGAELIAVGAFVLIALFNALRPKKRANTPEILSKAAASRGERADEVP